MGIFGVQTLCSNSASSHTFGIIDCPAGGIGSYSLKYYSWFLVIHSTSHTIYTSLKGWSNSLLMKFFSYFTGDRVIFSPLWISVDFKENHTKLVEDYIFFIKDFKNTYSIDQITVIVLLMDLNCFIHVWNYFEVLRYKNYGNYSCLFLFLWTLEKCL